MTCPDCRSNNAVPKNEAWDALAVTPPSIQAELDSNRRVIEAVEEILSCGVGTTVPAYEVTIGVSLNKIEKLYEAMGRKMPEHVSRGLK